MSYSKTALDYPEIISMLKSRGLLIPDTQKAKEFLQNVSYFRLAAYLRPFESDKITHIFKTEASFETAVAIYRFDSSLRNLIFSAIQQIEISLRSRIIHNLSLAHSPFWFFDSSLCANQHRFVENMCTLERELQRSKLDFIKEHYAKYGDNSLPPSWKTLELASFGCLTKLYFNFSETKAKKKIARSYGIPQHDIIESWMASINALRNACAHHERVWNRSMSLWPQLPAKLSGRWISNTTVPKNRLYAVLSCIVYWLNAIQPTNTFVQKFKTLLAIHPEVDIAAMGFPAKWQLEPLWN
jgi:abortive infection bacteriophage resistance protein